MSGRGGFAKGNAGGPDHPFARRVAKLRTSLNAVTEDDLQLSSCMVNKIFGFADQLYEGRHTIEGIEKRIARYS